MVGVNVEDFFAGFAPEEVDAGGEAELVCELFCTGEKGAVADEGQLGGGAGGCECAEHEIHAF